METPQSAPVSWLREGYAKAKEMNISITDDMHAIELLSKEMILLDPGYPNPKITHEHDLTYISSLLESWLSLNFVLCIKVCRDTWDGTDEAAIDSHVLLCVYFH